MSNHESKVILTDEEMLQDVQDLSSFDRNKFLNQIEKIVKIKDKIFEEIIIDFGKITNRNKFLKIY